MYYSCGVAHENTHYLFGGFRETRQILQLTLNCGLDLIGEMPFETMSTGACGTLGSDIVLCFDENRLCRYAPTPTGSEWKNMSLSTHEHKSVSIAASSGSSSSTFYLSLTTFKLQITQTPCLSWAQKRHRVRTAKYSHLPRAGPIHLSIRMSTRRFHTTKLSMSPITRPFI